MLVRERSRASLLTDAAARLAAAGLDDAGMEARHLLAHVLAIPLPDLPRAPDSPVSADQAATFLALVERRAAREPAAHLTGERGFWSLDLAVTPDVLIPRPDTECLVEAVLAEIPDRSAPLTLLDLGTGSGAIMLALLSELPNATGLGTDQSGAALDVARANARKTGLGNRARFTRADWCAGIEGVFDVIVSNPPYIETAIINTLEPEVQAHEPHSALDGGPDGLCAYRAILSGLDPLCGAGALLGFEIGFDQARTVSALMIEAGWPSPRIRRDFGGNERVLTARK